MFKLNSDGDLAIENNRFVLLSGAEAIGQAQSSNLKWYFGEWFLNKTGGVDWIDSILPKGIDPVIGDAMIKNAILNTPGTISLDEFDLTIETTTRELTLNYRSRVLDGVVTFNEVVPE